MKEKNIRAIGKWAFTAAAALVTVISAIKGNITGILWPIMRDSSGSLGGLTGRGGKGMKQKENFCMNCRHRIIESDLKTGFSEMYCKKHYWISLIGRDTFYKRCKEIRGRKKRCEEWEQGGIKGFFQHLFKKHSK